MKRTLLIMLLLIVILFETCIIAYLCRPTQSAEEFYHSYVQDKLGISFETEHVDLMTSWYALSDQEMFVKLWLSTTNISEFTETLDAAGWNYRQIPSEFTTRDVLDPRNRFEKELLDLVGNDECWWIYVNEYYEHYGARETSSGGFTYGSTNYRVAVYIPEQDILYYKECDS